MSDPPKTEQDRIRAAELYREGLKLEKEYDYRGALQRYEQSLELCDDETVMAAYLRVVSAIGPM